MDPRSIGLAGCALATGVLVAVLWSSANETVHSAVHLAPSGDEGRASRIVELATLAPAAPRDGSEREAVHGRHSGKRVYGKSVAETLAELEDRRATGRNPQLCLTRLGHYGTREADEALVALFADEEFQISRRSQRFAKLLADVDDPRIGEVAMKFLKEQVGERPSWSLSGYMVLAATKYGTRGRELVFDLLTDESYSFRNETTACVAALRGSRYAPQLIAHAREHDSLAKSIFDGLMAWDEVAARRSVRSIALDPKEGAALRLSAIESYGRSADRAEFASTVSIYWSPREPFDRDLALCCARAAAKSRNLSRADLTTYALPVLEDALFGDNERLRNRSLATFSSSFKFRRKGGRRILERFAADTSRDDLKRSEALALLER
jgi:hypothetical protein